MRRACLATCVLLWCPAGAGQTPEELERTANTYDDAWQDGPGGWVDGMRALHAGFRGTKGLVIHVGDSITYANPSSQWVRYGKGRTQSDNEIRRYMRVDDRDRKNDGVYLASHDVPHHRSYTAETGMSTGEFLTRPAHGLPSVVEMFVTGRTRDGSYNDFTGSHAAEVCFLLLGTNDVSAQRPVAEFRANMVRILTHIAANRTIVVPVTIPPHCKRPELARACNDELRKIASTGIAVPGVNGGRPVKLPLVDYYEAIVSRRPKGTWNGTLLNMDDVHPAAGQSAADPYANGGQALKESGYLLRCWLIVQKMKEIKSHVLDGAAPR